MDGNAEIPRISEGCCIYAFHFIRLYAHCKRGAYSRIVSTNRTRSPLPIPTISPTPTKSVTYIGIRQVHDLVYTNGSRCFYGERAFFLIHEEKRENRVCACVCVKKTTICHVSNAIRSKAVMNKYNKHFVGNLDGRSRGFFFVFTRVCRKIDFPFSVLFKKKNLLSSTFLFYFLENSQFSASR